MTLPPEAYITAPRLISLLMTIVFTWSDNNWDDGWTDKTRPEGIRESTDWLRVFDGVPTRGADVPKQYHIGALGPIGVKNRMDRIIQLTQGG